jgi:hypothetical protein
MTREGKSITLSISPEEKEALRDIALQFGQTWGEKPNISQLIKAIANRELLIIRSDETPAEISYRIKDERINEAIGAITDSFNQLAKLMTGDY